MPVSKQEQSHDGPFGRYPQSIVCENHPGRPADTLLRLSTGILGHIDKTMNVCRDCDAAIKAALPNIEATALGMVFGGNGVN